MRPGETHKDNNNPIFTTSQNRDKLRLLTDSMAGRIVSPEIDSENERRRFLLSDSVDLGMGTGAHEFTAAKKKPPLDTVMFRIQNVRDLFLDLYEENNWNDPDSFTCVRLPFEGVAFAYDHEFFRTVGDQIENHAGIWRRVTVVMFRAPRHVVEAAMEHAALSDKDREEIRHIIDRRQPDSFIASTLSIDGMEAPGAYFLMLDETGHVLTDPIRQLNYIWIRTPEDTERLKGAISRGIEEKHLDTFARHGMICLTALQFLNCKNVEVVDNPPSRQMRRQAEREGKPAPVTYKTLVVHSMGKKRVSAANPDESVRHGVALHIVRGHFKNFSQGPGLGRAHAHGVYWWESMVRGNPERGRVVKDYEVRA